MRLTVRRPIVTLVLLGAWDDTTRKETFEFWRTVSQHYRDHPVVALYELWKAAMLGRPLPGAE